MVAGGAGSSGSIEPRLECGGRGSTGIAMQKSTETESAIKASICISNTHRLLLGMYIYIYMIYLYIILILKLPNTPKYRILLALDSCDNSPGAVLKLFSVTRYRLHVSLKT